MKIEYVDFGIANNLGNKIIINKVLKKNKALHDYVLKHELEHSSEKFSIKDFKHEFQNPKMNWKLFWFSLEEPSTWVQNLPFIIYKGDIYWDINLAIVEAVGLSIVILFFMAVMKAMG